MKKQFNNSTIDLIYRLGNDYKSIHKELLKKELDPYGNCIYWKDKAIAEDIHLFFDKQVKYTSELFELSDKLNEVYISEDCSIFDSLGWYPFLYTERSEFNEEIEYRIHESCIVIFKSKFNYVQFFEWISENIDKEDAEILNSEVNRVYQDNIHLNKYNLDYAYLEVLKYMIVFFKI